MELTLSPDVTLGIKRLGNSTLLNEEVFTKLVHAGFCALTDRPASVDVNDLCSSKGDVVKEAYTGLLSLLVEATSNAISPESVQGGLSTNYSWPADRAERLANTYRENQSKLTAALTNIGTQPLHITDVSWRLDYCVQTSAVNSTLTPLYFIKLVCEGQASDLDSRFIKFVCTQHELQDLVSKFKDALRHIERIAAASE